MEEAYAEGDLWFIDDPGELTLRHNWRKDILDSLLERTEYCGKITMTPSVINVCWRLKEELTILINIFIKLGSN